MSKPNWDALTEQLRDDPNPNTRRKACALLAATRDPAVIPFLKNAYVQDEDEHVRDAAHDALAVFRAIHEGKSVRHLPVGDRVLSTVLIGLIVLFVASLGIRLVGSLLGGDDDGETVVDNSWRNATPTNRDDLVRRIRDQFDLVQQLTAQLRGEILNYNNTGQVACPLSYTLPGPAQLSQKDNYTYPDLEIVGANLDASLITLEKARIFLMSACADPATQMEKVIKASTELDSVDGQLGKVASLLQSAISNPAPTVGPTITPLPTLTFTPSATFTPAPPTATVPATATLPVTETPLASVTPEPPTVTVTPRPTETPLPLPKFDYAPLLRELSAVYPTVMGDLKNNFKTGMIDQWEAAAAAGQPNANYCTLQAWPAAFAFSAEQLTELQSGQVADPRLEEAVDLQSDGMGLAYQARALFERDCASLLLANSATQGLDLAQRALDLLLQSQTIYDEIRKRSS
ncbi:MAG: HEAT repeat domain-containing protein [Chloroflexi bacterium]|nr:HEAT repeat domain-containing protein [Chloroflexota bacterium]